ncbi:MAG: beta-phosphoglucomutase [Bacillota bacterium]
MITITEKIQAIIFDLDGVITDTAEYHYQSWKRLAEEEGLDFDRQVNEQLRGVSRRQSLNIILGGREFPERKKKEMTDKKNRYYQEYIDNMTEEDLLPGIKELVERLKEEGYKLAIASSSCNARPVIQNLKIGHYFEVIADGNSVEETKPAPDLFLYTADRLGLYPAQCVVVEDAESGIEGARAAGMNTIGIGPEDRVGQADYRYQRVSDIDPDDFLGKIRDF